MCLHKCGVFCEGLHVCVMSEDAWHEVKHWPHHSTYIRKKYNTKHLTVRHTHTLHRPLRCRNFAGNILVFMSWYLKSHLWHHRETTLWFMLSSQPRCRACVTFLHNRFPNHTKLKCSTQDTAADPSHTHTHKILWPLRPLTALHDLLTQLFPAPLSPFFPSLHTDGWSPLCAAALQCLYKALLFLCCFKPPGKRSRYESWEGAWADIVLHNSSDVTHLLLCDIKCVCDYMPLYTDGIFSCFCVYLSGNKRKKHFWGL